MLSTYRQVSVKQILQARWETYELTYEVREVEEREVKKMFL